MTVAGEVQDGPVEGGAPLLDAARSRGSLIPILTVMTLLAAATAVAAVLLSGPARSVAGLSAAQADLAFIAATGVAALGLLSGFALALLRNPAADTPRAMDAARRYAAYWRDTTDSLFTIRVTPDGDFLFDGLNPAHEMRTGLRHADIAGRRARDVLPAPAAAAVIARYRQCLKLGAPLTYTETLDLPGGRRHWETSLAPLRGVSGRIEILLGSARDVTEQVKMREALAEGQERLRTATELAPDILFVASRQGVPEYVSPPFFTYTGLPKDLLGRDIYVAVHPDDIDRLVLKLDDPTKEAVRTEIRIRGRDGVYRWFQVRARIVNGLSGPKLYGVAANIDAVKRTGEEIAALNERLTNMLSSISDCYYTLDRTWRMTSINPRAVEWFGRPEASLLGADIRRRLRLKQDLREAIGHAFATGEPVHLERSSTFHPGRWIEFHIYPSTDGASIFFRDITDRWRAHAEIEEATELLQGSLDAMSAQVALLDSTGSIVAVNRAWREDAVAMKAPGCGLGAVYLDLCRQMIPELEEAKVARGLRALLAGRRRTFGLTYVVTTPDGLSWRRLRINRFAQGEATRLIVLQEDVTEVAQAQAALRETSDRLLTIQDEERQRIAVELHDSTSQHLVALGLGVVRLRRTLKGAAEPVLDDMSGSITEALKEIRVLSYLLNPPNLERDGLEATVRRFVNGFGVRTGLQTLFRAEGDLAGLDPVVQRAVFRVIQEALSNVHRHAAAAGAEVDLAVRGGQLVVRIADDGRGIGPLDLNSETDSRLGVGIPGMRRRVAQLDGVLTIAGDDTGTVVEATLPLPQRATARATAIEGRGRSR